MDFKAKVLVSGELDYLLPSYKVSKKFSDGFGKRYILYPHTH